MNITFRDASYRSQPYGGGKLIRRVEASCGAVSAHGANRTEAKAALLEAIERQCEYAYRRRYLVGISAHDGEPATFALHYSQGWAYDIVLAGRVACTTGLGDVDFDEAYARMLAHFDQY